MAAGEQRQGSLVGGDLEEGLSPRFASNVRRMKARGMRLLPFLLILLRANSFAQAAEITIVISVDDDIKLVQTILDIKGELLSTDAALLKRKYLEAMEKRNTIMARKSLDYSYSKHNIIYISSPGGL